MRRSAALLAAALLAGAPVACGGGGAEPGAPDGAVDLVLDFTPNAVHAGLYAAQRRGIYRRRGFEVRLRGPSASTDAPKLLRSGRADFAILDIHDLGIARERGLDIVGVAAIVQRPLAAVLARRDAIRRPRELEGRRVGVTGLPSDDAVLDSVVAADGGRPSRVRRVTIGFEAVASLAAGRVAAATGFWNAEGRALRRRGVGLREFRVDRYGAPPYPELVLATTGVQIRRRPDAVEAVVEGTVAGYRFAASRPDAALRDLLASVRGLDAEAQRGQLRSLLPVFSPTGRLAPSVLREWARWDARHGILRRPIDVSRAFDRRFLPRS
jgi:putative hydroxymethylpyrimidine transport system substrate-binding protein